MTIWAQRAAEASRALVDTYWDNRRSLFRIASARRPVWLPGTWRYWWQAHALDALVLDGDTERAGRLVDAVLRRNHGITNNYYDDMAWMGLALHGLRSRSDLVDELMATLRSGVHPEHGALVWRRGDSYLNVPANAPTTILAARTGDEVFARRLNTWSHSTLVTPDGVVRDGFHPGGSVDATEWTYNYGTVIGADVALGELQRARRVATAATRLVGPDGVLPDEGAGDRSLFKGIFARHLGALVTALDDAELRDLLVHNAAAAWASRSRNGLVGPDWTRRPERSVELSAHLSGVLLFHTTAAITRPPR